MDPFYLDKLAARYRGRARGDPGELDALIERYRQYRSTSLLDLAAVASTLAVDTLAARNLDPLALEAIRDTNPNFDPDHLYDYSDEQWMGIANTAKGKYFEYLVVDRLNDGETVGDVALPDGFSAKLADSMTQPGWDVQILDDHGDVSEFLQLKATDSTSYVLDALDRYPDITVLSTDEVAQHLTNNDMVLNSDISERDIEAAIGTSVGGADDGFLDQFWESFHPIVPLLVIAGTQGYRVVVGKQSVADAAQVAKGRVARGLTAASVGAVVKALGGGFMAIPAAIFVGWVFDRSQNIDDLIKATRAQSSRQVLRRDYYRALVMKGA